MIEVQYNDVNYTSKKNREIVFNSINDNILRDFLDNDMDLHVSRANCQLNARTQEKNVWLLEIGVVMDDMN